jgi:DNA-binding beta-propeller fold protein YncE
MTRALAGIAALVMVLILISPAHAQSGYVLNYDDGTVSVIDPSSSNAVDSTITGFFDTHPFEAVADESEGRLFVTMQGTSGSPGSTVAVIDLSDNSLETEIAGFDFPSGIVKHPTLKRVFVVDTSNQRVVQINTNTLALETVWNLPIASAVPYDIAIDSTGDNLYISDRDTVPSTPYAVHQINLNTSVIQTIRNTNIVDPTFLAISPDDGTLLVSCLGNDSVAKIELTGFTYDTAFGFGTDATPTGVVIHPSDDKAYVALSGDNEVKVLTLSTLSLSTTVTGFNGAPGQISFNDDASSYYVGNLSDPAVVVSPSEKEMYVVDESSDTITQIFEVGRVPVQVVFATDTSSSPAPSTTPHSSSGDSDSTKCVVASTSAGISPWMVGMAILLLAAGSRKRIL